MMLKDLEFLRVKAIEFGASRAFPIDIQNDLVFQERARMVCVNSCSHYGKSLSCPPHIPDLDYEKAIKEYDWGLIVLVDRDIENSQDFGEKRVESTNTLHGIMLRLEKEAFELGYYLTTSFRGGSCRRCKKCGSICLHQETSRIPIEGIGVNVIDTLAKFDINLKFGEGIDKFCRVGLLLG